MMCGCENALLMRVYETGFALDDVTLYLDTHPTDSDALNYYKYAKKLNEDAVKAYEEVYGPLMINRVTADSWDWVENPWANGMGESIMWRYEKRLQYPVNISTPNPKMAAFIISQYGLVRTGNPLPRSAT